MAARETPADHSAFAGLPVTYVSTGSPTERLAVHINGRIAGEKLPLVCVPGYQRNMSDFSQFLALFRKVMGEDWPVVLIDLRGRGRSSDRRAGDYASPRDAHDIAVAMTALAIGEAAFLGQGYGGQVIMALGAERPRLIAGTALVDAGPVTDPRGLVRLRTNLREMGTLSGADAFRRVSRQILALDYPQATEAELDAAALRTHFLGKRGKVEALFDDALVKALDPFELDDVLVPQWGLFATLNHAPMMLMRSQYTEQLRRGTFDEMLARRRDAVGFEIEGQGSPPLLSAAEDVGPVADFVRQLMQWRSVLSAAV